MREFAMRISSLLPGIPPSGSSQPARAIKTSSEVSKEFFENLELDFLKSRDCWRNITPLLRELNSSEVPEKSSVIAQLEARSELPAPTPLSNSTNMLEPREPRKSSSSIGM